MIVDVTELMVMPEFNGISQVSLTRRVKAIEDLIRAYTNNNFQNRHIRFEAPSDGSTVYGYNKMIAVGDTVQITESVNDGVYVVREVFQVNKRITLDADLLTAQHNLVTKVVYPNAVIEGAIGMIRWQVQNSSKVGVKAETLSRHSVTYFDQDANNQLMGYPVTLLGFLKPYIKARF